MKFHDELNPKLWENEDLKEEVKAKLHEIADAFIEFLEINEDAIEDIVITGSSASYNYTKYSDIDLHIVIDFEKVHEDCPIVEGYLLSKKSEFNSKHDIFIYGVPVELYAEAKEQGTVHNGLYSLKDEKWIDFPQKIEPTDNDAAVEAKYNEYVELAKDVHDADVAADLIEKIRTMRKSGLSEGGEFSTENLTFKKLRDEGIIGNLMEIKKQAIDKQLSLESYNEDAQNILDIDELKKLNNTLTKLYPWLYNKPNTNYSQDLLSYAGSIYGSLDFVNNKLVFWDYSPIKTIKKDILISPAKLEKLMIDWFGIGQRFDNKIKDLVISYFPRKLDKLDDETYIDLGTFRVYADLPEPYLTIANTSRTDVYSINRVNQINDEEIYEVISGRFSKRFVIVQNGKIIPISNAYVKNILNSKNESIKEAKSYNEDNENKTQNSLQRKAGTTNEFWISSDIDKLLIEFTEQQLNSYVIVNSSFNQYAEGPTGANRSEQILIPYNWNVETVGWTKRTIPASYLKQNNLKSYSRKGKPTGGYGYIGAEKVTWKVMTLRQALETYKDWQTCWSNYITIQPLANCPDNSIKPNKNESIKEDTYMDKYKPMYDKATELAQDRAKIDFVSKMNPQNLVNYAVKAIKRNDADISDVENMLYKANYTPGQVEDILDMIRTNLDEAESAQKNEDSYVESIKEEYIEFPQWSNEEPDIVVTYNYGRPLTAYRLIDGNLYYSGRYGTKQIAKNVTMDNLAKRILSHAKNVARIDVDKIEVDDKVIWDCVNGFNESINEEELTILTDEDKEYLTKILSKDYAEDNVKYQIKNIENMLSDYIWIKRDGRNKRISSAEECQKQYGRKRMLKYIANANWGHGLTNGKSLGDFKIISPNTYLPDVEGWIDPNPYKEGDRVQLLPIDFDNPIYGVITKMIDKENAEVKWDNGDIGNYNIDKLSKNIEDFPKFENKYLKTEYAITDYIKKYGFATQEDLYNNISATNDIIDGAVKDLLRQDKIKFEDGKYHNGINGWALPESISIKDLNESISKLF